MPEHIDGQPNRYPLDDLRPIIGADADFDFGATEPDNFLPRYIADKNIRNILIEAAVNRDVEEL